MKSKQRNVRKSNPAKAGSSRQGSRGAKASFVLGAAPSAPARHGDLKLINPSLVGNSAVFPNRLKKTFTTSGNTTLTGDGVGVAPQVYTISANSLFDPDYTGTGHSPRYYDTLVGASSSNAPYGKYNVVTARLRVEFVNSGSAAAALADVGIFARPATVSTLDTSWEMYESPNAVAMALGSGYSDNGIRSICVELDQKLMTKFQNSKDILDDVDNMGVYNGDPAMELLFDIMYIPLLTTSTNQIYVRWVLEQDAVLFTLNETVDSLTPPSRHPSLKPAPVESKDLQCAADLAALAGQHPKGCFCDKCAKPESHDEHLAALRGVADRLLLKRGLNITSKQ